MLLEETALRDDAERRGPDPRRESGRADLRRERREPARELRVGLQPIADLPLVAVVDLDDVDGDLRPRRRQRLEIAQHVRLVHAVEEVVPAAPPGQERTGRARRREPPVRVRELLEQEARVQAEGHADALERAHLARLEPRLDGQLRFEQDVIAFAPRVEHAEGAAALEDADQAGGPARRLADDRRQVRFVPAEAVLRGRAERVVHAAQPGPGGEGGLARVVEIARARLGPGLPAVAQETQRAAAGSPPAKAQHDGAQEHRARPRVARDQVEPRDVRARVGLDPQLDARQALRAGAQRRARTGDRRAACGPRYRGLARPHGDPGRLDATRGGVARNSSGVRHGRESITRACRRTRKASPSGCDAPARCVLDGATGTELERRGVSTRLPLWSADALLRAPALVGRIHRDYAGAGAEALTANTFRTQRRTLAREGLGDRAAALTALAVAPGAGGRRERRPEPAGARVGPAARGLLSPGPRPGRGGAGARARRALREPRRGGRRRDPVRDAQQPARGARGGERGERDGAAGARELRLLGGRDAALGRAAGRRRRGGASAAPGGAAGELPAAFAT